MAVSFGLRGAGIWLAMWLGLVVSATATMPVGVETIEAKLDVTAPEDVDIGEPFEVVFTFETLQELPDHPVKATLLWPESADYLSGDTLWEGQLTPGKLVTITGTFQLTSEERVRFKGLLEGRVERRFPLPNRRSGDTVIIISFLNGTGSELIGKESWERRLESGRRIVVTEDAIQPAEVELPPPPVVAKKVDVVATKDGSGKPQLPRSRPVRHVPHPPTVTDVEVTSESPRTIRLETESYCLCNFSPKSPNDTVDIKLVKGRATMTRKENGMVGIKLWSDEAKFQVTVNGVTRTLYLTRPKKDK